MHRSWKQDTTETYNKLIKADWPLMKLDEIITDRYEIQKLKNEYF